MKKTVTLLIEIAVMVALVWARYNRGISNSFSERYTLLWPFINFAIYVLFIDGLRRLLIYFYTKRKGLSAGQMDNFQFGVNNIAKFLIGIGVLVSLFGLFGIDVMTLLTSLSIVAAAIAIITKDYISDFLMGLYFSFSNNFEIYDYVKLGEHKGKIIELQMLKIKILNDDDDQVIIPNSHVYNNEIINYTKRNIRSMSIDFQVDITSVKDIDTLERDLIETLESFKEFIDPDSFKLKIVEMKKDYIDFKFQYTLRKIDRDLQREIRSKTVRHVLNFISYKSVAN